jgi:S-disulfanyl-L-cysteine oxidoreductase SoxD
MELSAMCKSLLLLCIVSGTILAESPKYGVGRAATPEEVKTWDISISPAGAELPEGSGTAVQGKDVYASKCAKCHGGQGQGGDEGPLVGGQGTLRTPKPLKTVGSYWPYATTLFDYVNRAMPFKQPGTLTHNQVYAVVAHVLHLNGIIAENAVMDAKTLPRVKMPNRNGFVPDFRPDVGPKRAKK